MLDQLLEQNKYRIPLLTLLFIALIYFIWAYNLKPLGIQKEINTAVHWQKQGNCEKALNIMEEVLVSHSFIDGYARLKYVDIIGECIKTETEENKKLELVNKAIQVLKENIEIRPSYTRNWWFLGTYTNYLISVAGQDELKEEANYYFSQAHSLSPKRQEILKDWAKTHLLTGEFAKAKETAEKCIGISSDFENCWWFKGLAQIYLGEMEAGKESIAAAKEQGYDTRSKSSLSSLISAYAKIESYPELIETYQGLIKLEPTNFQHYASLAFCYKMIGDYGEARKAAQKVIELSPESRASVEKFLRTLR